MTPYLIVLVTCPTRKVARRLADKLVNGRLAACVNVLPGIESTFRWQGKVDRCREMLLVIKTTARRFPQLRAAVRKLHPYDVPEIIALPVVAGHAPYLRWVRSSVLTPKRLVRASLAKDIERTMKAKGLSLEDLLSDLRAERQRYNRQAYAG